MGPGGAISHFVTPNFVQAAFGSNNLDRRLECFMQPLIGVVYIHLRSEVIDLHFDLHELRKYGKITTFFTLIQLF